MGFLFINTDFTQLPVALLELCLFFCLPLCVGQVPGDAEQGVPVAELLSGALRDTRAWFRNALKEKMLQEHLEHVTFSSHPELQVCHLIMAIKRGFTGLGSAGLCGWAGNGMGMGMGSV